MSYFILFLLSLLCYAEPFDICHNVTCADLQGKICSAIEDGTLYVGPCPSDLTCQFNDTFVPNYNKGENYTYCKETYEVDWSLKYSEINAAMKYECNRLDEIKSLPKLVNSKVDLKCDTDLDCELSDGSTTTCTCGLDSFKYCQYGPGDDVHIKRAEAGCAEDKDKFAFYTLSASLDLYIHDTILPCMISAFPDIAWWSYLNNSGTIESLRFSEYGLQVAIGLGLFLILI